MPGAPQPIFYRDLESIGSLPNEVQGLFSGRFGARQAGPMPRALEDLLESADFVSLHVPPLQKPQHICWGRRACLVNTARGGLIDEAALVESLESGHVAAAGLDVLEEEPPRSDHPLLAFPQVYYTPHLAWYSETSRVELRRRVAEEALRVLTGKPALNPVVI